MTETSFTRLAVNRGVFLLAGVLVVAWRIVPFDLSTGRLPWPDIFYGITMAYVVRRPEWAPAWAIFAVFFLRDILTMAPLGLFTLLMILGTEIVRANLQAFREYPFALEWVWIAGIFALITLGQQVVLGLMLADPPALLDQLWLILLTATIYPVIVFVLKYAFGFERPQPGETDAYGNRL